MNKVLVGVFIAMCLLGVRLNARLGESVEECEKRYGNRLTDSREIMGYSIWFGTLISPLDKEAVKKNGEVTIFGDTYGFFRVDRYIISVLFIDNKAERIAFIKMGKYDTRPEKLSADEMIAFLSANKGENGSDEWTKASDNKWKNEGSGRQASYGADQLRIDTAENVDRMRKRVEDSKEANRKKQKEVLRKF